MRRLLPGLQTPADASAPQLLHRQNRATRPDATSSYPRQGSSFSQRQFDVYFELVDTAEQSSPRRDPDEEEATGYVGVMQAIISIFADEKDKLRHVCNSQSSTEQELIPPNGRYVDAGSTKISFLLKAPLYLVCVSDWNEPESVVRIWFPSVFSGPN